MFAHPWWVNLLILVPVVMYFLWRRRGLELTVHKKSMIAAFALAFGFVEAAVVVYLRAALGDLPGYHGTLSEVRRMAATYDPAQSSTAFPQSLLTVEVLREAATMVMLVAIAFLAAPKKRERWASFLWAFAIWDITYYAGLWATVGWPRSLKEIDVLFLIPQPWVAQVWYPLLVSAVTLLVVGMVKRSSPVPMKTSTQQSASTARPGSSAHGQAGYSEQRFRLVGVGLSNFRKAGEAAPQRRLFE